MWYAVGSYAPNGLANLSSVSATNATVYGDIIGGDGAGGALDNTVTATGTTITRYVYGGRCDDNQTDNDSASGNQVILLNSSVGGAVCWRLYKLWQCAEQYGNISQEVLLLITKVFTVATLCWRECYQ